MTDGTKYHVLPIMISIGIILAVLAAGADPSSAASRQHGDWRKVGELRCKIPARDKAIHFGSNRKIACRFVRYGRKRTERYAGTIRKFGIEVGVIGPKRLLFAVYAKTRRIRRGALAGEYRGVSAEITVGKGIGGNALFRTGDRRINLSPIGVQEQSGGFNFAGGYARMTLRRVR